MTAGKGWDMSDHKDNPRMCMICNRGMKTATQDFEFRQWTNKGYVPCRVVVSMAVCDNCGLKFLDEQAESLIEGAAQRAIDENE